MRISVALILDLVADVLPYREVLEAYPYFEAEALRDALRYAAFSAAEEAHPSWPASAA